jgi:hypothetical protein
LPAALPSPPSIASRPPRSPRELALRDTCVHHQRTDAERDEYGQQSRIVRLHLFLSFLT